MNPILNEKRYIDNTDWKSVDDELPDEFEKVLVYDETEGVCRGYIYCNQWQHDPIGSYASDGCLFHVTHWAKLPKGPK